MARIDSLHGRVDQFKHFRSHWFYARRINDRRATGIHFRAASTSTPDTTPDTVTYDEKALQAYARMRVRANRRSRRRKRGQVKWMPRLQEAVLLRTPHQSDMEKGVTSKFQRPYEGPCYVTRIVNPSIYEISDARRKNKGIFNKGSLRRFRQEGGPPST
jgi:hypothetical protein